ncbi:MAG: glycosyltransferase family 39 protein, partial [Patescibacteria group bacterium]
MAKKFLIIIFILGAILRLVGISQTPPGLTPDEAAFGYNAYSLLLTGRDEWGVPAWQLPFTNLQSFGDFKLPLYAFLSVPSVKLLGLTEYAVRLPNAILGSLSVLAIYMLATRMFGSKTGLLAAILLAISPWSIQMSRGGFEANVATLFLPMAIYAYLSRRYFSSALFFALGIYIYHSTRLLTLPVIAALYLFKPMKKFTPVILFACLVVPGVFSLLGSGSSRSSDLLIFHPTDNWKSVADRRFQARVNGVPDATARIFSNKVVASLSTWYSNYIGYLSPYFLFVAGPSESTYGMIPGRGVLYSSDLALLLIFTILFIRRPHKNYLLLIVIILLGFLPASLSKGVGFAANRTIIVLPFILIGLAQALKWLLQKNKFVTPLVSLIYLTHLVFFLYNYTVFSKTAIGEGMHIGKKELFERLMPIANNYPEVKISRTLSNPHI